MNTLFIYDEPRHVTMGELCEALADRAVYTTSDGQYYNVGKRDISRLAETLLARAARKERVEAEAVTV